MARGARQLPWFATFLSPDAPPGDGKGKKKDESELDDAAEERIVAQLERLLEKGDKEAARKLFDDNARIRRKYQRMRDSRDELREKAAPEGALVLTGDEAKAVAELRTKGIKLLEIGKALEDGTKASTELVTLRRKDSVSQIAELLGWDTDVLLDRLDHSKLHAEIVTTTEKVDGQDVVTRTPKVRPIDKADAALEVLDDSSIEKHWPKFRGALVKGDAPTGTPANRPSTPPKPAPVTRSGDTRTPPKADIDRIAEAQLSTGLYGTF